MSYPVLMRPSPFGTPPAEWTKAEAREVFDWLLGNLEPRTDALLGRLGLDWDDRTEGWLDQVEGALPRLVAAGGFDLPSFGPQSVDLRGHVFAQDFGPRLSAEGEALGADLGLLLGRSLQATLGDAATWLIGSGGRTYVSRNLPVLRASGSVGFDPLLIGPNVGRRFVLPDANPRWVSLAALHHTWLGHLSAKADRT